MCDNVYNDVTDSKVVIQQKPKHFSATWKKIMLYITKDYDIAEKSF